ncbi:helix-turn-helix domain-containing protein [Streptomyces fradiae]|uniref:helix-turn-helix domain-containing protein n=1 Tax=Streptomyces fradiae TaxID=1906 RepID=UPI00294320FB|nr:helix-turn-helix domain-containing protein [Streptomyces fradiae]WOI62484.1 helix-turn-helix domain-containing protein [Streptomyces fradiae]
MIKGGLPPLGLGEAEERAYEALLLERADHVEELARLLDLPRKRVDTALDRLVEHGFARPPDPVDGGGLPHPAAPAAAIRVLIDRRQAELHRRSAELQRRSAELERLRLTAERLAAERLAADRPAALRAHGCGGTGAGGEGAGAGCAVERLAGRGAAGERTGRLLAGAEREVLLMDRAPYADLDMGGLLARGVEVRAVLDRAGLTAPGRARAVAALVRRGLRVRVAAGVPTRLLAVDRRVALLPPSDAADPRAYALVVADARLREALAALFEAVWEGAAPWDGDGGGGGGREEGPEQRELLRLLAAGLKDEAIARRLGVHVHTARRRISRLLESLDARTRFQAGARATARGWLDT